MNKEGAKATGELSRDYWMTPPYIIDRVKQALGPYYFDPCPKDPDFDGLITPWRGFAFINPPFSEYKKWVNHGMRQPNPQIWICNTKNSTSWWQMLFLHSSALCLLTDRVAFINPETMQPSGTAYGQSQCLFYLGSGHHKFMEAFSDIGTCLEV